MAAVVLAALIAWSDSTPGALQDECEGPHGAECESAAHYEVHRQRAEQERDHVATVDREVHD